MSKLQKSHRAVLLKSPYIVILIILLLGVTTFIIYHNTGLFRNHRQTTASPYTKGEPTTSNSTVIPGQSPSSSSTGQSNTGQPGDQKSNSGGNPGAAPLMPTGDFVSAHGSSANPISSTTTLSSVCNTSPGASCQISFTNNGIVKTLPAQATDRGGATYWNSWTPKSIGLTDGSWHIEAIANFNGQVATAEDALNLVVSP